MHRNVFLKLAAIGVLSLLLLIPLGLIRGVVSERKQYRFQAEHDIATSWSGVQTVIGPIIEIPYEERHTVKVFDRENKRTVEKTEWRERRIRLLPENLTIEGSLKSEERYRGIYRFPVYTTELRLHGSFRTEKMFGLTGPAEHYRFGQASLYLGITDVRGIKNQLALEWSKNSIDFQPGGHRIVAPSGVHAELGNMPHEAPASYPFAFDLELRGMSALHVAPIGKQTAVQLASNWPHPKFTGRFLPEERSIGENGFAAEWSTTHFATNSPQELADCSSAGGQNCRFRTTLLGVELFDPVDVYQQTERSMKYAILFVVLTFVSFFLFEILRQLRIHPIQYLLVGCALAMFYLLLISLSEHLPFFAAYLAASTACVSLITFYVCAVLSSARIGLFFGTGVAFLYGILYVLLQSQDHALVMGSIVLFAALTVVMAATRQVNWYQIAAASEKESS